MRTIKPRPQPRGRLASTLLATVCLLSGLAAMGQAHAQLQIVQFEVQAEARASQAGQPQRMTLSDNTTMGLPWALTAQLDATAGPTASTQVVTGTTSATQTKTGWFSSQTIANHDWQARRSELGSRTRYYALLETTQPDTPLVLHFNFLGSVARTDGYYSGRGTTIDVFAYMAFERNPAPNHIPDETASVWGFFDRLDFLSGYQFSRENIDLQQIGTPVSHIDSRWVDMRNIGEITRDSFSGTLNFGLLQPGEQFAFVYVAGTNVQLDTPYATTATARVLDPFSFGDAPPPQFTIDGLELPPAPVPEPASACLGLAGLALLAALRLARRTPAAG